MRKFNRVVYRFWHNKSKSGLVGYVGKDSYWPIRSNLNNRRKYGTGSPKLHKALKKYSNEVWNIEVLALGFKSDVALNKAEIYWIRKFDSKNKGYNCTDGGGGLTGAKFSISARRKLSKAATGNKNRLGDKQSLACRKKISETLKGRKLPASTKRKISKAHKGKIKSVAHCENLSKALKGNKNGLGTKRSLESRKRMSRAQRKRFKKEFMAHADELILKMFEVIEQQQKQINSILENQSLLQKSLIAIFKNSGFDFNKVLQIELEKRQPILNLDDQEIDPVLQNEIAERVIKQQSDPDGEICPI